MDVVEGPSSVGTLETGDTHTPEHSQRTIDAVAVTGGAESPSEHADAARERHGREEGPVSGQRGVMGAEGGTVGRVRVLLGRVMNPPLWGVLGGVALGVSPFAKLLVSDVGATAGASLEVRASVWALRTAFDSAKMLGGATLAVQAVVLAASMFQAPAGPGSPRGGASLLPEAPSERRALLAMSIVRLLVMPLIGADRGCG